MAITKSQWDSLTDQQQWDYVTLLESICANPIPGERLVEDAEVEFDNEPPIDPTDTAKLAALNDGSDDGDYSYGRAYW